MLSRPQTARLTLSARPVTSSAKDRDDEEPPSYAEVTTQDQNGRNPRNTHQNNAHRSTNLTEEVIEHRSSRRSNNAQFKSASKRTKTGKTSNVASSHPRVAVLLGVKPFWYLPLLVCRALAVAPAAWWGLRYALHFLGELLFNANGMLDSGAWSVEKRFRVTEVFLAVFWVGDAVLP